MGANPLQTGKQERTRPTSSNQKGETSLFLLVEIEQAFGKRDFDAASIRVDVHANVLCQRNQKLALGRIHHQNRSSRDVFAGELHVRDAPDPRSPFFEYFAAGEIRNVVAA